MRSFLGVLAVLLLLCSVVYAADNDAFTITVQVQYMDVTLRNADETGDYTTWPLGLRAEGEVITQTTGSSGDHIFVDNNCNCEVDFSAYQATTTPAPCGYGTPTLWTAGTTAGADIFKLELGKGTQDAEPATADWQTITASSSPGDVYLSDVPAGEDHHLYTRFTVPTSVSDGCVHQIDVTVVATPSP